MTLLSLLTAVVSGAPKLTHVIPVASLGNEVFDLIIIIIFIICIIIIIYSLTQLIQIRNVCYSAVT